jgi:hypothetical protein
MSNFIYSAQDRPKCCPGCPKSNVKKNISYLKEQKKRGLKRLQRSLAKNGSCGIFDIDILDSVINSSSFNKMCEHIQKINITKLAQCKNRDCNLRKLLDTETLASVELLICDYFIKGKIY